MFKVGDKVVCVLPSAVSRFPVGSGGIVASVFSFGDLKYLSLEGERCAMVSSRFELVEDEYPTLKEDYASI